MKRSDEKRLEDLRAQNELAELEILTLTPDDVSSLDPEYLTISQLLVIGDLFTTLNALSSYKRQQTARRVSDVLASANNAERRTVYPGAATVSPDASGSIVGPEADDDSDDESDPEGEAALRALFASLLNPAAEMVNTVNGPMPFADIPRDENGVVTDEWIDENCTCDDHTQKRENGYASVPGRPGSDDDRPFGQYV
jgi:hypothetical protein